jgi:hypothetical protein
MNFRKTALAVALAGSLVLRSWCMRQRQYRYRYLRRQLPYMSKCPLAQVTSSRRVLPVRLQRREHVWVKGDYQAERHGEHYVASAWAKQDGRYHFDGSRWEHDK